MRQQIVVQRLVRDCDNQDFVSHMREDMDRELASGIMQIVGAEQANVRIHPPVEKSVTHDSFDGRLHRKGLEMKRTAVVDLVERIPVPEPCTGLPPSFTCDYCRNIFHALAMHTTDGKDRCCPDCFERENQTIICRLMS